MFEINKEKSEATQLYMDAGIQEPVRLTDIRVEESEDKRKTLIFEFTNNSGEIFRHRENKRTLEDIKAYALSNQKNPKKLFESINQEIGRKIYQITSSFLPPEEINIKASNFEELAEEVKKLLTEEVREKELLRIKLFKNEAGYTNFPKYSSNHFIENVTTENSKVFWTKKDETLQKKFDALLLERNSVDPDDEDDFEDEFKDSEEEEPEFLM